MTPHFYALVGACILLAIGLTALGEQLISYRKRKHGRSRSNSNPVGDLVLHRSGAVVPDDGDLRTSELDDHAGNAGALAKPVAGTDRLTYTLTDPRAGYADPEPVADFACGKRRDGRSDGDRDGLASSKRSTDDHAQEDEHDARVRDSYRARKLE